MVFSCRRTAVVNSFCQQSLGNVNPSSALLREEHNLVCDSVPSLTIFRRTKTVLLESSSGVERGRKPSAILLVSGESGLSEECQSLLYALRIAGYGTVEIATTPPSTHHDGTAYWYEISLATGMLKLISSPPIRDDILEEESFDPPKWVPIVRGEENVLVANGWSFLDPDESEPMSAFDIDDANAEAEYNPKWGAAHEHGVGYRLSSLGFDVSSLSKDSIMEAAKALSGSNEGNAYKNPYSRGVLLDGRTDPPNTKITSNGFDFRGSTGQSDIPSGIFFTAIGGLPLFSSTDLSPTTASSGWLSFARPLALAHVMHIHPEEDAMDRRIEVVCARSRCHLGHYFGPTEGYCINASALRFVPSDSDFFSEKLLCESNPLTVTHLPVTSRPISWRAFDHEISDPVHHSTAAVDPAQRLLKSILEKGGNFEMAVLGCGCFWHVEYALRRLPGVYSTRASYAGGHSTSPTYEDVCGGATGHAEVVSVVYDPDICPSNVLFDCFFAMHDPTKVRAHGKHAQNTGQYRSCIFVTSEQQERVARECMNECREQLGKELSTEIRRMGHQNHRPNPTDSNIEEILGRGWCWSAEDRHQRHDEKRNYKNSFTDKDSHPFLTTLTANEWLDRYGKRTPSKLGSSMEGFLHPDDDGMAMMMI